MSCSLEMVPVALGRPKADISIEKDWRVTDISAVGLLPSVQLPFKLIIVIIGAQSLGNMVGHVSFLSPDTIASRHEVGKLPVVPSGLANARDPLRLLGEYSQSFRST